KSQKRPAASRNIADFVADAEFGNGRQRIPAPGNGKGRRVCNGTGQRTRATSKGRELEHPDRTIPNDGTRLTEQRYQLLGSLRPNIQNEIIFLYLVHLFDTGLRICRKLLGANDIDGNRNLGTALLHALN